MNIDMDNEKVFEVVKKIPKGRITTYKLIGEFLGIHPRAVGRILHFNKNPIIIPCHRVVKSNGDIGGYIYGVEKKKELLKKEGIDLKNILNYLWNPKEICKD